VEKTGKRIHKLAKRLMFQACASSSASECAGGATRI
jgi:hypothetical protein